MAPDPIRNASFDYARLLAVFGIIWFHVQAPGAAYGYAGLSFFIMLLMFLAVPQIQALRPQSHRAPAVLRYAAARGRRLIMPWIAASVLYGGLKLIDVARGAPLAAEFTPIMWLTGTALHLWFLPFAFVMCMLAWPLCRVLAGVRPRIRLHAVGLLAGLALAALAAWQSAALPVPLAQWAYALPAVLLGLALGLTGGRILAMLALGVFCISCALSANWIAGLMPLGLALSLLLFCALLPIPPSAVSAFCARASYGIYLIHPAIIAVMLRAGVFPPESHSLALVTAGIALGIVAIWEILRRPRKTGPTSTPQGTLRPISST